MRWLPANADADVGIDVENAPLACGLVRYAEPVHPTIGALAGDVDADGAA